MLKVLEVDKNGVGINYNVKNGDNLVAINGQPIADLLDFEYFDGQESFVLTVQRDGRIFDVNVNKADYETLGFSFEDYCYLTPRGCANKCIFCFVDQLPKNQRKTLYVKDDDWRLSFASGTYVTLTNLKEGEKERIAQKKFSPIFVSVHATDDTVRRFMLGNPNAQPLLPLLKYFADNGIVMHTQIVVCASVNDGEVLQKTLNDLYGLYPAVKSVAVVPVGLTSYRQDLYPLQPVNKQQAQAVLDICEQFDSNVYKATREHFVFCSDEMYLRAERQLPSAEFYGEYDQIENGVGLITKMVDEFDCALSLAKSYKHGGFTILTGESATSTIQMLCDKLKQRFPKIKIEVKTMVNNFFGKTVTVAGLLTGLDMANQLKGQKLFRTVIIPKVMMKETQDVFLDGMTLAEFSKALRKTVKVVDCDGFSFVSALCKGDFYE